MKAKRKLRFGTAGAVVMAVALLASPAWARQAAREPALAYAPKGATMIAHFDMPALVKMLGAATEAARECKELADGSETAKNLQALGELLAKVQSVDAYVVATGKANFPMLALHTKCGIDELYELIKKTDSHLPELTRLDKGKYVIRNPDKKNQDQEIFTLLDGDAIDGVGASTILVAMAPSKMTMDAVKTIGTGASDKLAELAGALGAGAQCWLVADFSDDKDKDLPQTLSCTLDLDEGKGFELKATFADKPGAELFVGLFEAYLRPGSAVQTGLSVVITGKADREMWAKVMARYLERQSVENLVDVGMAIQRYMAKNRFKLPGSLNELVRDKFITAQQLVSPASGRQLKTDKDGVPLEEGDYVYINHGQLVEGSHRDVIIVAYEPSESSRGQGILVLFADGHVERATRKAFEEQMKASAKEAGQEKGN
jgi:hypothetical protein